MTREEIERLCATLDDFAESGRRAKAAAFVEDVSEIEQPLPARHLVAAGWKEAIALLGVWLLNAETRHCEETVTLWKATIKIFERRAARWEAGEDG